MAGWPALRTVKDQQLLMWINPDTRHAVALHTVTHGQWMTSQHISEQLDDLVRALWNVHPDNRSRPLDQRRDLADRVRLDGATGERQDPDPGHVHTLDLKEAHSALPLSEEHVKRRPPKSRRYAPSMKLSFGSPDRLTASAVKAEIPSARASGIEKAIW
jgi:hypothetical protein